LVSAIVEKHKYYKEKVTIKENSFLVMPWNVGGSHWIIAFVDFCTKECFIMDPMNKSVSINWLRDLNYTVRMVSW